MSEYNKSCTTCKKEIRMSNNSGKWLPLNLDNTVHRCFVKETRVYENKEKPLTLEDLNLRLQLLESIVLDPRRLKQ